MLRLRTVHDTARDLRRRDVLRAFFLTTVGLAAGTLAAAVAPFARVNKVLGLGNPVPVGMKADILARFAATDDRPIFFREGRFFLLHPPGGIIAAYRKCTHLGCAVPWSEGRDRFHCPCHGSQYDKRTAVVLRLPAPRPLSLFHISETDEGSLIVDTNPLRLIERDSSAFDPSVIEVRDS